MQTYHIANLVRLNVQPAKANKFVLIVNPVIFSIITFNVYKTVRILFIQTVYLASTAAKNVHLHAQNV
jgi:hypothetical protein